MAYCMTGHDCTSQFTEEVRSLNSTEFSCTWKVDNYTRMHPGIIINDGSTRLHYDKNALWNICVYPDGFDSESNEYISITVWFNLTVLQLKNSPYLLKMFFVDREGQEIEMHASEDWKHTMDIVKKFELKKYLLKLENKWTLLPYDRLTIRFKAFILGKKVDYKPQCVAAPAEKSSNDSSCLQSIFNEKKFSDVVIVAGERQFYAYKGILANRSPVFASMFEHDMQENNENVVLIEDIKHEVVEQMLRFIYSGKVENIEDVAYDLLPTADKYELKKLKAMCEEALITEMCADNVVRLLIHADKYSAEALKQRALTFFKMHAREIIDTEEFKKNLFTLAPVFPDILARLVL